jgi:hypothetical protein
MGDLGASPVSGAEGTTEHVTRTVILDPVILRFAVLTYLVVLPVGHLFPMPINGTTAVGSDIMLALVLLAGLIDLGRMSVPYFRGRVRGCRCFRDRAPAIWGTLYVDFQHMGRARGAVEFLPGLCCHQGLGVRGVGPGSPGNPVVRRNRGFGRLPWWTIGMEVSGDDSKGTRCSEATPESREPSVNAASMWSS